MTLTVDIVNVESCCLMDVFIGKDRCMGQGVILVKILRMRETQKKKLYAWLTTNVETQKSKKLAWLTALIYAISIRYNRKSLLLA